MILVDETGEWAVQVALLMLRRGEPVEKVARFLHAVFSGDGPHPAAALSSLFRA